MSLYSFWILRTPFLYVFLDVQKLEAENPPGLSLSFQILDTKKLEVENCSLGCALLKLSNIQRIQISGATMSFASFCTLKPAAFFQFANGPRNRAAPSPDLPGYRFNRRPATPFVTAEICQPGHNEQLNAFNTLAGASVPDSC
ncbi:Uncharacterised protein [Enterobacter cloacae]|uniref:Uncharacterized protein n=1 Tax=Enterobacter cloacae TaxID=550 RepID=A0A377M198_ENTCL|nr:Uncharacterised protein [Enterobacter cloacae]